MSKLFLSAMVSLLLMLFCYDFFSRIYLPLQQREVNQTASQTVSIALNDKVPATVMPLLQEWDKSAELQLQPEKDAEPKFDTGTLGHLQLTLLAIYSNQGQRTAVVVIQDKNSGKNHTAKLKQLDSWNELSVTKLDTKTASFELNNKTINLRLFDTQTQRVQG